MKVGRKQEMIKAERQGKNKNIQKFHLECVVISKSVISYLSTQIQSDVREKATVAMHLSSPQHNLAFCSLHIIEEQRER